MVPICPYYGRVGHIGRRCFLEAAEAVSLAEMAANAEISVVSVVSTV
jgi:hypothetical protein